MTGSKQLRVQADLRFARKQRGLDDARKAISEQETAARATEERTARLKAARLAKEAADKEAAVREAAEKVAAGPKPKRTKRA